MLTIINFLNYISFFGDTFLPKNLLKLQPDDPNMIVVLQGHLLGDKGPAVVRND